jgi:hypothetical protein
MRYFDRATLVQEDVQALDVAMDDAVVVQILQSQSDLQCKSPQLLLGEKLLLLPLPLQ